MVKKISEGEFKDAVASGVSVVDFSATWCGPCKMLSPVIDELAAQYEGKILVAKANVDEAEQLSAEYGIMSIPTVLFFKNGELVERHTGFAPIAKMQPKFEALL